MLKKAKDDYRVSMAKSFKNEHYSLPKYGLRPEKIEERLVSTYERDEAATNKGKFSGTRYCVTEFESEMKEFVSKL